VALSVADARALDRAAPIPLVTLTLMDATVLRISDRVITVGGNTYDALLMGEGSIEQDVSRLDSGALNADYSLTLRNTDAEVGTTSYNNLVELHDAHPLNGALVEVHYVFQDNGETTPAEHLFTGIAEEPSNITRKTITLRVGSLTEYRAKTFSLQKLSLEDFPLAMPSDSGKCFPELIGQFKTVECVRTKWPMYESDNETLLNGAITASDATITVDSTNGFG